jgi:transcriptional regulator with XRE-family HTH domain
VVSERRAFGDRMRRARERRGVTLEAIAQATKVPASLFAALERGDVARWPTGVYSRAYIRAYAEAIGVDADEAVDDFGAAFADTAFPESIPGTPPRRIRAAVGAFRLTMDDQPEVRQARTATRAAFAVADLVAAAALAYLAHLLLETSLWATVAVPLTYFTIARLVADESFVGWAIGRFRAAPAPVSGDVEDVPVSDIATA